MVGEYRLHARLGAGGMGRVYLGYSLAGRAVAVKIVHRELARDPAFASRFRQEVAAAQAVSGAYTAPVVAVGLDDDPPWLATAFVPGPSLAGALTAGGRWAQPAVWKLAAGLVEALRAIHGANLVHRDLKPENVVLAADGPRVIDFGISRALDSTSMTTTGTVIGTPSFMSPEQAQGAPMGSPSDVFSLGCVLAFAATGASPFGHGDPATVLYRIVHVPPVLDGVPGGLREFVAGCLAKRPEDRPPLERLAHVITAELPPDVAGSPASFWPPDVASAIRSFQAGLEASGAGGGAAALRAGGTGVAGANGMATGGHRTADREATRTAATRRSGTGRTGRHAASSLRTEVVRAGRLSTIPADTEIATGTGDKPVPRRGFRVPDPADLSRRQILTGVAGMSAVGLATIGWELSHEGAPRRAGTQQHAGRVTTSPARQKPRQPGTRIWTTHTGPVAADLALADGIVYAASTNGSVYALRADGSKIWSVPTSGPVYSAPAVANGFVYVGSDDHNVYALRTSNGAELWNFPTQAAVRSGPTVTRGFVYVGSNDHNLYALRARDGAGQWAFRAHGPVVAKSAVALGLIVVASLDDNMYVLHESNGKELYGGSTGGPLSRGAVVVNGIVYLGSSDHHVYAIHAVSGHLLWSHPARGPVNSTPAVAGGVVYVGSDDHHVYALSVGNGAQLWKRNTGGIVRSGPVVAGGVVYAGSGDSQLYALRASDGTVLWRFPAGGPVISGPVVEAGVIYVASEGGGVNAVQA
jgi:outer membrane protein assembly factor BamB